MLPMVKAKNRFEEEETTMFGEVCCVLKGITYPNISSIKPSFFISDKIERCDFRSKTMGNWNASSN